SFGSEPVLEQAPSAKSRAREARRSSMDIPLLDEAAAGVLAGEYPLDGLTELCATALPFAAQTVALLLQAAAANRVGQRRGVALPVLPAAREGRLQERGRSGQVADQVLVALGRQIGQRLQAPDRQHHALQGHLAGLAQRDLQRLFAAP